MMPCAKSEVMDAVKIEKKVEEILKSRKNINSIVQIYNLMQEDVSDHQILCMQGLERLFTTFLARKEFDVDNSLKVTNEKEWQMEMKYVDWLHEMYGKTVDSFYKMLASNEKNIEEQALISLMSIISYEGKHQFQNKEDCKGNLPSFPSQRLQKVLEVLLSAKSRKTNLLNSFEKYTKYKDIFFFTWKILSKLILQLQNGDDILIFNLLELIEKIPLSKSEKLNQLEGHQLNNELLCRKDVKEFAINQQEILKFERKVWQNLINRPISAIAHRKLMLVLLEKFLPHLENPIYLTDFLMASTNMGGANALLAMQGILTLVQKCNMEYPNIYCKLYGMFESNIFHTKYKSRLFHLADIFLSSSHLPESMVAAFAKRVARLCLTAQVPDIVIGIRFIENLILRHPDLKRMIRHPDGGTVAGDPFLPHECDPMKANAMDSCLWEMTLLKNHVQPSVSSSVNFIDGNLPSVEYNLGEVLDLTTEQVFDAERKKKAKSGLNISRPEKIAKLADDRVYKFWTLT